MKKDKIRIKKEAIEQIQQRTRDRIGVSTLERYTGSSVDEFQPYVLLTNFKAYVDVFSEKSNVPVRQGSVMRATHSPTERISVIDFTVGSPMAALMMELLSFVNPRAAIMLGMCGGLRSRFGVGDFFAPIAAIRDDGTSNTYLPPQCPALSCFMIQKHIVDELQSRKLRFHNGIIHTTNIRFWEFNEDFRNMLHEERAHAIDMECATLFSVGSAKQIPIGALMLISDLPLQEGGIKTADSAKAIFEKYMQLHIDVGISVMKTLQQEEPDEACYQF